MADVTAPPTDDQTPPPVPAPPTTDDQLGDGGKKALDAERDARKASDKRAKDLERELETFRKSSMTAAEVAVAEAKAAGRAEVSVEYGTRLARADFIAQAARRNPGFDAATILDDLNLARFVGDDGEPDIKAITGAVERLVPVSDGQPAPIPSLDLGTRGAAPMALNGDPLERALRNSLGIP